MPTATKTHNLVLKNGPNCDIGFPLRKFFFLTWVYLMKVGLDLKTLLSTTNVSISCESCLPAALMKIWRVLKRWCYLHFDLFNSLMFTTCVLWCYHIFCISCHFFYFI